MAEEVAVKVVSQLVYRYPRASGSFGYNSENEHLRSHKLVHRLDVFKNSLGA